MRVVRIIPISDLMKIHSCAGQKLFVSYLKSLPGHVIYAIFGSYEKS